MSLLEGILCRERVKNVIVSRSNAESEYREMTDLTCELVDTRYFDRNGPCIIDSDETIL